MMGKVEYLWRHLIAYPVLRLLFHNPRNDSPVDLHSITKLLFLRYDRIGDMIVTTPIFRSLKLVNPGLHIGVFASEKNADIIRYNPYVDSVYVLHSNWLRLLGEIFKARKERYEVIVNLIFNRTTSGGILANIISPAGLKIGQGDEKYRFYFNRLLAISRTNRRMIETFAYIISEVFHIELHPDQLRYEIYVDEKTTKDVARYLRNHHLQPRMQHENGNSHYLVFNLSANDSVRRISPAQAYALGMHLGSATSFRTVLLHAPHDTLMLEVEQRLTKDSGCLPFPDHGDAHLLELASLIEGAVAVVTPDTSIIHFASAASTPVVGFYTKMQDVHEWLPHGTKSRIVASSAHKPASSISIPDIDLCS